MNFLSDVRTALDELMPEADRPVVVYSAAWPIMRELGRADQPAVEQIVDVILEAAGDRTVCMPTFTRGYHDGVSNLDNELSSTGIISELFRQRPGTSRTLSAFFSFAARGPMAAQVRNLKPADAWGDGSLYEWMESSAARFIMLGAHPTHCSYLHRLESCPGPHSISL